jgi:hypothetical protein
MGAFASADRALAVVSDRGQDRAPRPADFLADRHRHVHVHRDPRAVRAHHAGRRRHSGDVVISDAGRALGNPNDEPPPAYLCLKPSKIPARGQKIARRAG